MVIFLTKHTFRTLVNAHHTIFETLTAKLGLVHKVPWLARGALATEVFAGNAIRDLALCAG